MLLNQLESKSNESKFGDKFFKGLVIICSIYTLVMVALVIYALSGGAIANIVKGGFLFCYWYRLESRRRK